LAVECTAMYFGKALFRQNLWLYNAFLIIYYTFYSYFFSHFLQPALKKVITVSCILLIAFSLINLFFIQGPNFFNSYTMAAASILMLTMSILYLKQLLNENKVIKLSRDSLFWISIGILIFHLGALPYFSLLNYLNKNFLSLSYSLLLIIKVLNIVMYLLFSVSFLCRINTRKS
jgi:hypothetical protein